MSFLASPQSFSQSPPSPLVPGGRGKKKFQKLLCLPTSCLCLFLSRLNQSMVSSCPSNLTFFYRTNQIGHLCFLDQNIPCQLLWPVTNLSIGRVLTRQVSL